MKSKINSTECWLCFHKSFFIIITEVKSHGQSELLKNKQKTGQMPKKKKRRKNCVFSFFGIFFEVSAFKTWKPGNNMI